MKVLLILVDAMRPDSFADLPTAQNVIQRGTVFLNATTVMPSVTLPAHMSLFHSVDPSRHGTTINVYAPQVRPIKGLFEVLKENNKRCGMFFGFEELRDLGRPGSLVVSSFYFGKTLGYRLADIKVVEDTLKAIETDEYQLDFIFCRMGEPDQVGHKYGWMSKEYLEAVGRVWDHINTLLKTLPEDYTVFITADHGGHHRTHGTTMPEDMTIPIIALGKDFAPGQSLDGGNIKDIAPTVVKLFGLEPDEDWDGKSLI